MESLFESQTLPLSKRMMPKTLADFAGQKHLTGPGKPISVMIQNQTLHSMIFFGPPATGKTSLAEIIAHEMNCRFIRTNALTLDAEEIRSILAAADQHALTGEKTIVFIDEIHRLIKPKQDAFLSSLEHGKIVIIGATTENPFFVLQPALRSRVFIFEFKAHERSDLEWILDRTLASDPLFKERPVEFSGNARDILLDKTQDARRLLNALEMAVFSKQFADKVILTPEDIETTLQSSDSKYSDKEGHYDTISAFIKSVRGSDPNAAVYYLARMIHGGEDPLFIARRLIILAAEDIGLAYPEALPMAVSCYQAIERIGMPEGRIVLSETTIFLAGLPKSNSAYLAIDRALADIEAGKVLPVPPYLREAGFSGARQLGRGIGYKYPHDYPGHYVEQPYTSEPVGYYQAGQLGFEKKISDWLNRIRPADASSADEKTKSGE